MNNMKKWNYIISAISILFGFIIIFVSKKLSLEFTENGPGAGFWPALLGGLLIFIGILLAVISYFKKSELEKKKITLNTPANKRVYIMMGIIVAFCVLLYLVGFYISIIIFIPVTMILMEVKSKKEIILTTVITTAFIFVVFDLLLNTSLPKPFFL